VSTVTCSGTPQCSVSPRRHLARQRCLWRVPWPLARLPADWFEAMIFHSFPNQASGYWGPCFHSSKWIDEYAFCFYSARTKAVIPYGSSWGDTEHQDFCAGHQPQPMQPKTPRRAISGKLPLCTALYCASRYQRSQRQRVQCHEGLAPRYGPRALAGGCRGPEVWRCQLAKAFPLRACGRAVYTVVGRAIVRCCGGVGGAKSRVQARLSCRSTGSVRKSAAAGLASAVGPVGASTASADRSLANRCRDTAMHDRAASQCSTPIARYIWCRATIRRVRIRMAAEDVHCLPTLAFYRGRMQGR
jgi:hypothetical protein